MQDLPDPIDTPLAGLDKAEWLSRLADTAQARGHFQPLGNRHFAAFVDAGSTLLVSFESIQGIHTLSDEARPLGWDMLNAEGWSSLVIAARGDTWFRDPQIYGYFDALIDDGFFDEFDTILFYGAGPCAYAAAAYSVAAPGATVLAIQPQATLDPRVTEWDDRFTHMRRTSFTDRYGYAPDMLDAARKAFVIYDPQVELDAMHAALFTRPNVEKYRLRFMGSAIQTELLEMGLLKDLLVMAAGGTLDTLGFARMMRARRDHPAYLRAVLATVDRQDRPRLATMLCRSVLARFDSAPRFARRLKALQRETTDDNTALSAARL